MFRRDVPDDFDTATVFNAVSQMSILHEKLKNIFSYKVAIRTTIVA